MENISKECAEQPTFIARSQDDRMGQGGATNDDAHVTLDTSQSINELNVTPDTSPTYSSEGALRHLMDIFGEPQDSFTVLALKYHGIREVDDLCDLSPDDIDSFKYSGTPLDIRIRRNLKMS